MKRAVTWGAAVFLVALGLITFFKFRTAERAAAKSGLASTEKVRVTAFWAAYNKASALRTQGEFAPAAAAYREALQFTPEHEDSLYYLGTCLYELGDYRGAEAALRELVAKNPESGRGYGQLGKLLSAVAPGAPADFARARQAFERELQIYREQAGPQLELGSLDLNQGQWKRAGEDFRTAVALGSPDAKFLAGYVLFLENRYPEANRFFREVLKVYWADRKITGKGVLSEGDVLPSPDKPLTALQRAALKATLFSYWGAVRSQVPPEKAAADLHLAVPEASTSPVRFQVENAGVRGGGGRAAWADFDRDGQPDLIVGGLGVSLVLYRNQGGRFVDVTRTANLAGIRDVWEPYWVDFDGDGYPDLYLVRPGFTGTGQNLLYHNNHNGAFSDVTASMGLSGARSTMRACFADFDGNGKPDLLEVGAATEGNASVRLWRNTGTRLVLATGALGSDGSATAVDCAVADYDGDGKPDVFVQFWRREGVLYHNQGNHRFLDATASSGLQAVRGESFSAIFFDYDKDGHPDLLLTAHAAMEDVARSMLEPGTHVRRGTPRLFRNQGNGTFQEVTASLGLDHAYATMQALAVDLDGDGWTDLLMVSGAPDAQYLAPGVVLKNMRGEKLEQCLCVPDATAPGNSLGAAVSNPDSKGSRYIYFASNPVLRRQTPGGLYRMTRATVSPAKPRRAALRAHAQ